MELLDTLASKSTEELKHYLTDEGYKDESVEMAINILRERGVNIDNELRDRQVAFCSQCKNQKLNPKEGLICALTGQKATFGTNCKDFDQDGEVSAKAQQHEDASEPHWGGFIYFYWFVLALGAVLTLVGNFYHCDFSEYDGSVLLFLADAVELLLYSALCIFTIVAFFRYQPNAVMLGKLQNYVLIGMNGLSLLLNQGAESGLFSTTRLIGSVVWAIIFLIYLYTSEQVNRILPKKDRHAMPHDKAIIWGGVIAVVVLYLVAIIDVAIKSIDTPVESLEKAVAAYQSKLPIESESFTNSNAYLLYQDSTLVLECHSKDYENREMSLAQRCYGPIYSHELMMFSPSTQEDTLIQKCYLADYAYQLSWYDNAGEHTYDITLSREELNILFDTVPYFTSPANMAKFMSGWNLQLPADYVGGMIYEKAEMNQSRATVYLTIQDIEYDQLPAITEGALKEYVLENKENLVDYMVTLAMLNQLDLVYKFSASSALYWGREVRFTPAEYNEWE